MRKSLLGALALVLTMAGPASASAINLYASFSFTDNLDPQRSIPLAVGTWHVGSIGGPLATAADLHTVLSNMSGLTIGGTMQGLLFDFGAQGQGFTMTNPNLGGAASDDLGFGTAFNWSGWGIWSASGGNPGGSLTAYTFNGVPTFVALHDQTTFRGDLDSAFGNDLTFRFAFLQGPGNPFSALDSGVAILASSVPEPATLLLLGTGFLAGLRWFSRSA